MPELLINYINQYGYLILFGLVLLQELGVPSFPNEIVLYYFGYLCSENKFSLSLALPIAVLADIIGTLILFFAFYYFGTFIIKLKPSWIKFSASKITKIKTNISSKKSCTIFLGRITPFLRGYISVLAGLLHISFAKYSKQVIISAILWTGGWVFLGYVTSGCLNNLLAGLKDSFELKVVVVSISIAIIILFKFPFKRFKKNSNRFTIQ